MTKEILQVRITERKKELETVIQADNQAMQARQKQLQENQTKVNELNGAIKELEGLAGMFDEQGQPTGTT